MSADWPAGAQAISLWWPAGTDRGAQASLGPECVADLGLAELVAALSADAAGRRGIEQAITQPCRDPAVIRYRQDVLGDLLENPGFAARLADLMPAMSGLARAMFRSSREHSPLHEVVWRLGELEGLVECIAALQAALAETGAGLRAAGWQALARAVAAITADATYQSLAAELPGLLAQVRTTASVTIGVNLDQYLQPVEATLLAVNDQKFRGSRWLGRLFGNANGPWEGIAPLHAVPEQVGNGPGAVPVSSARGSPFTPLMVPLFRDLAQILEKAAQPVARSLRRYADVNGHLPETLSRELPFYLGAVRLVVWLREQGLPVCRPELAPEEERVCQVTDAYNINLALQLGGNAGQNRLTESIVANDIAFGPAGRVIVLTGPNQGGKTTYLQAIGLIQVLAQAGLYVPGTGARISPVDGIYTHFPVEERLAQGTGRFGDEARRLQEIFTRLTRSSLVLLNESLSSTSAGESLYLGQDILRVLRLLGCRAIFATHLHELAAGIDELNAAEPGDSLIASMVASPSSGDPGQAAGQRFKIMFGPPLGRSYAREIARRYGVSYVQLKDLLARRGALGPNDAGEGEPAD